MLPMLPGTQFCSRLNPRHHWWAIRDLGENLWQDIIPSQRPSPQSNLMRLAAMLGAGSWPGTLPTVGEAQSGGPPGGRRVAIVVVSTD